MGRSGWVTGACAFSRSTKAASSCPGSISRSRRPEALTKYALVKKAALREAVLSIRKLGYATTDQELEIGLRSIDGLRRRRCGGDERERLVGASFARADGQKLLPVLKANAVGLGRLVSSAAG